MSCHARPRARSVGYESPSSSIWPSRRATPLKRNSDTQLTFLSTLGTVKEHPDDEIIREFLETMHDAGWSKKEIAGPEYCSLVAEDKFTLSGHHYVDFVSCVRALRVVSSRGVDFKRQRSMLEQFGKPFPAGAGNMRERIFELNDFALNR